jgi:hypothetical protein
MKRLHLLSIVAASLLFGTATVAAQGMHQTMPESAPAAQQNAPAEKIAPPMRAGEHNGGHHAQATGQETHELNSADHGNAETNALAHPNTGSSTKSETIGQAPMQNKSSTAGQGAAPGAARLSSKQRTKITTIIKKQNVNPTHLSISVHVGARVPASVRYHPLPVEVVDVDPRWRGYDFILIGDQVLIINPHTHLIVAILEA